MLRMFRRFLRNKKGAALLEYALLAAGIALIGAASISTFGHKTNDLMALTAAVLPGAHADDNNPMGSGKIIETAPVGGPGGPISLDIATIVTNNDGVNERLGNNLGLANGVVSTLVVEQP